MSNHSYINRNQLTRSTPAGVLQTIDIPVNVFVNSAELVRRLKGKEIEVKDRDGSNVLRVNRIPDQDGDHWGERGAASISGEDSWFWSKTEPLTVNFREFTRTASEFANDSGLLAAWRRGEYDVYDHTGDLVTQFSGSLSSLGSYVGRFKVAMGRSVIGQNETPFAWRADCRFSFVPKTFSVQVGPVSAADRGPLEQSLRQLTEQINNAFAPLRNAAAGGAIPVNVNVAAPVEPTLVAPRKVEDAIIEVAGSNGARHFISPRLRQTVAYISGSGLTLTWHAVENLNEEERAALFRVRR